MTDTILVTDYDFPNLDIERRVVDGRDAEIVDAQAETADEVIQAAREADADALLAQYAPIDERVLDALDVQAVGRYGIGVDTVDLEAATDNGVVVVNVPDYCEDEVATHTIAPAVRLRSEDVAVRPGDRGRHVGLDGRRADPPTAGEDARFRRVRKDSTADRRATLGLRVRAYRVRSLPVRLRSRRVRRREGVVRRPARAV